MIAVLIHELKIYFHSLTAYVFCAFLLAFTGIGAMIYNIESAVSNFEYVLDFCSLVFVVIVPILTMRVLAEERRQKTDQLLYTLPVNTTEVILGKFLALLIVFLLPMGIICIYPLIFSRFGDVYLLTAYGALAAFFVMGAAFMAEGVFISSLTENQGLAAGIGIAVILLDYFSVRLSGFVSGNALASLIVLFVIVILFVLLIRYLTKNDYLAYGVGLAAVAALMILFMKNREALEGLLPAVMTKLSLYQRFSTFVNGVFDLNGIVYYVSVIVFFLFLSVQSLEKRRYN